MQNLETRPRVTENPAAASTTNRHYREIAGFPSQNFPQQNISRNPILIDNPLDEYYADINLEAYSISTGIESRVDTTRRNLAEDVDDEMVENIVNNETENRAAVEASLTISYVNENTSNVEIARTSRHSSSGDQPRRNLRVQESISATFSEDGETGDFGTLPDIRESRV